MDEDNPDHINLGECSIPKSADAEGAQHGRMSIRDSKSSSPRRTQVIFGSLLSPRRI
jgi:hypothetical protein